MKLLPESKTKKLILFVIIGIAVMGIIYINFIAFSGSGDDALSLIPTSPSGVPISGGVGLSEAVLPFGTSINANILQSSKFTRLRSSPEFFVSPEELGNPNPFILP